MEANFDWSDAAFEAALRGAPDAPPHLAALVGSALFELTDPIDDELAKHHTATAAAVARSVAHTATSPAPAAAASTQPTLRRKRLRRLTFAGAFSGMWAKVALGAVAMAAVGTGAAVTDNLPAPIQAVFAEVAEAVGVELPHPDDALEPAKRVGPDDPASLPEGGGVSDEARTQGQERQNYLACLAEAEAAGIAEADADCDAPTPPGQDDDFVPPGQDDEFTPPGQDKGDDDKTPPGQDKGDDDKTPPGRDKDT